MLKFSKIFYASIFFIISLVFILFNKLKREEYLNLEAERLSDINQTTIPKFIVEDINCKRIFNRDERYISVLEDLESHSKLPYFKKMDYEYESISKNCKEYRKSYVTKFLSYEEVNYPLAFQIIMYKDVAQLEILLKEIYRPQNEYCIHVDRKAHIDIQYGVRSMAKCFENIEVIDVNESVDVRWSKYTNLEPEIICARNLWKRKTKWKYLINLTGQEFPIKTMLDIVKILKAINGANSIQGTVKHMNKERFDGVPPFGRNVTVLKGAIHIVAQRGYIDFILHNKVALDFLEWVKQVKHPDETYFASLNHSPLLKVPGSYLGHPESHSNHYPFIARYKNWRNAKLKCHSKRVRSLCIFGMRDIPNIIDLEQLFVNKFHIDHQPYALLCMAELIRNRTISQYMGLRKFDTTFYENLDMSHNNFGPVP